ERSIADLGEIVRSTLALKAFDLPAENILLQEDYAEELPMVAVNGEEIRQVVLNLVLNAEQALLASGRGGTIKVRTWAADAAAFVEVSDDGPGIPSEAAGRIFEPFFTTKPVG